MKLQLDMNDKEDMIVSLFKVRNKLKTKQQAVKEIINQHGGVD